MAVNERILPARRGGGLPPDVAGAALGALPFVLDGSELFEVHVLAGPSGLRYGLLVRILQPDGAVQHTVHEFLAVGAGGSNPGYFRAGAGAILNLSAYVVPGTGIFPRWGECYVTVNVVRQQNIAISRLATLIQSYITTTYSANWPGTPFRVPVDGPGAGALIDAGDGIAGSAISYQCPQGERVAVSVIRVRFTASAVAGNRTVWFDLRQGSTSIGFFWSTQTQTAGQSLRYNGIVGGNARASIGGHVDVALPPRYLLQAGDQIEVNAVVFDAGDQFTEFRIYGEKWFEPA